MNSIIIEQDSGNQNEKCSTVMMIMYTNMILKMYGDFRNVHNYYDDHKASVVTMLMTLTFACS
jgi:hypothetical protein